MNYFSWQKSIIIFFIMLVLSSCSLPQSGDNGYVNNDGALESATSSAQVGAVDSSSNPVDQQETNAVTDEQSVRNETNDKGFWGGLFSRFFGKKDSAETEKSTEIAEPQASNKILASKAMVKKPVILKEKPSEFGKPIGADLKICGLGVSCSGDMGSVNWRVEAGLSSGNMKRALDWKTENGKADSGLLEISRTPMGDAWPAKTVYSQPVAYGQFIFDFNSLLKSDNKQNVTSTSSAPAAATPEKTSSAASAGNLPASIKPSRAMVLPKLPLTQTDKIPAETTVNSKILTPKLNIDFKKLAALQPVFYARIVPLRDGKVVGKPSNEIKVSVVAPADPVEFKQFSPVKAYDVEIKSFAPLRSPDKGVCSNAMLIDTAGTFPKIGGVGLAEYKVGDRICPAPYRGAREQAWYESLWDAISSGVSWISEAYNDLKSAVVNAVGSIACGGNDICEKALAAGLDMGLVALGIPPTLPNFDQLVDQGFDYLAGELSAAAGCPDAVCREAIKKGLKEALEKQKNTDPACMDENQAHDMGMEPLCLPKGMKAHFDPAATHRGAEAVLVVKRNNTPVKDEKTLASSTFRIHLSAFAKNAGLVGASINNIEPYNKSLKIEKPLEGELFQSTTLSLSYIEPGKSIEIPIQLTATDYWVPGHKELMGGWTTVTYKDGWPQYQYNDWWMFYYGADLNLMAMVDGCFYQGGNDCIISIDDHKVKMPMTLYPGN